MKSSKSIKSKPFKFVLGASSRSNTGCRTCRKKKLKCDESFPECLYCRKRGIACVYQKSDKGRKNSTGSIDSSDSTNESTTSELIRTPKSYFDRISFEKPFVTFDFSKKPDLIINLDLRTPSPLVVTPSSLPTICLDELGRRYLEYFQLEASKFLAVLFDHLNYLKKLFFHLANNEETFTYIVAAWGALYCKNREYDDEIEKYLAKSLKKFNQLFTNKDNAFDYYFQLCFYLILSEMNVCIGDVDVWRVYFDKIVALIKEYGGPEKIVADFDYSHEIRFMVSNVQYNDIMCSTSLLKGTSFPMREYYAVFNHPRFMSNELSYGIDTYQGCHQPLLLLHGEIMNYKVKIDKRALEMENSGEDYITAKKEYLDLVHQLAEELDLKYAEVEPNMILLNSLRTDPVEHETYSKTYDLYKLCCKLNILLYIKQTSPKNYEVRKTLIECFELIDFLLYTKMAIILCLPLLTCGVCATDKEERGFVESRVAIVKELSPVKNLDKTWTVISRVWELNHDGNSIIDWSTICEEFGWHLNIC